MTNYKNAKYNFDGSNLTGVTFNDDGLQEKIAMLSFRTSASANATKYALKDQVIEAFEDTSGIDAGNSTNYGLTGTALTGAVASGSYTERNPTSSTCRTSSPDMRGNDSTFESNMNGNWSSGEDTKDGQSYVDGWFRGYWSTAYKFEKAGVKISGTNVGNYKIEASNDDATWVLQHTGTNNGNYNTSPNGNIQTWTATGSYNYWRMTMLSHNGNTSGNDFANFGLFDQTYTAGGNYAVQSTANTASASPTTADVILAYKNTYGTATLNTDLKAYVSRDGGTTWLEVTLVAAGDFDATRKLASAHDFTFTGAAGTDLRWKLTAHNQSASSKETDIHAISLGWK